MMMGRGTKGFGEGTHKNVNVFWIDTKIVTDTASMGTQSSNGVHLVNIEIELWRI